MFYSLEGEVLKKTGEYAVVSCGGIGFKVYVSPNAAKKLPPLRERVKLFTHFHVKDDGVDLFGFLDEPSLTLFELLISVNGVGPRTALTVLSVDSVERLTAAILERRSDLLLRASGIGKKTAERIILELQSKLELAHAKRITEHMTVEADVEEALIGLGYSRAEAREAVSGAGRAGQDFGSQLKAALKILGLRNNRNT